MKNTLSHVAIIMDGNRRWAKKNNMPVGKGHEAGAKSLEEIVKSAKTLAIPFLTVFALSSENLKNRSRLELKFLFALMKKVLREKAGLFEENKIRVKFIGDLEVLPKSLVESLRDFEEKLKEGDGLLLQIAVNYGGREEIIRAAKKIAESKVRISEASMAENLYTAGIPDPDLIIRTGGQKRLSNFLLWQASYSELYFTSTLWPDFGEKEFKKALKEFTERKRNFGS